MPNKYIYVIVIIFGYANGCIKIAVKFAMSSILLKSLKILMITA